MIVASRMPVAMLFVRCEKGISHHPAESVREQDVAAALDAGQKFLDEMALAGRA
jgi:allantoate deiminase